MDVRIESDKGYLPNATNGAELCKMSISEISESAGAMDRSDMEDDSSSGGRLVDRAFDQIKSMIINCELRPGSEVTEGELVELCGVGKAPIRAALMRLGHDGLVKPLNRRGYLIAPITLRDINELFELRLFIEPHVAATAANVPKTQEQLEELQRRSSEHIATNDHDTIAKTLRINRDYHVAVAKLTNNERITNIVRKILDDMERLIHLGLVPRGRSSRPSPHHVAQFTAIKENDSENALKLSRTEILDTKQIILNAIMSDQKLHNINLAGNGGKN